MKVSARTSRWLLEELIVQRATRIFAYGDVLLLAPLTSAVFIQFFSDLYDMPSPPEGLELGAPGGDVNGMSHIGATLPSMQVIKVMCQCLESWQ